MCHYAKNFGTDFRNFEFIFLANFGIFFTSLLLQFFCNSQQNLAHRIYVPICKKTVKDFLNFDFKIFGKVLKFYIWT